MNWDGQYARGAMRQYREAKRLEAEERNAQTVHEDTRAHREGRCRLLHEIFEEDE